MKKIIRSVIFFILFLGFFTGKISAVETAPDLKVTEVLFSGPKTTNMSSIKDFTKVKNFVLDTKYTLIFRIEGPIDLTDQNIISALNAIEYDWVFSRWGVYSPPSWWKKYNWKEPFIVTTNNDSLTGYIPEVLTKQNKELSPQINISQLTADKYEFIIDNPADLQIAPNVTISSPETINTTSAKVTLKGYSSHKDIFLSVINGETKEKRLVPVSNINKSDGSFIFSVLDLQEGENNIEISYSRIGMEPTVISKIKIIYKPTIFAKVKLKILNLLNKILIKLKVRKEIDSKKNKSKSDLIGYPTDETKKWLLASGAMLSVQNREGFDKLDVNIPISILRSEILDGWWGITDRKSAISILNWLKDSGHRGEFLFTHAIIMMSTSGNPNSYDEFRDVEMATQFADGVTIKSYDFTFEHRDDLYPKSLIAWDFVRLVNVARWSYTAGYITEDEAWRYMLFAGQKLQSEYSSWKELANHYILGRTYWNHETDHPDTQSSINYLLSLNSESPWNKNLWSQKLEEKTGDLMSLPKLPDIQTFSKDNKNYDCKKFVKANAPVVVKINFVPNKNVLLDKSVIRISQSGLCSGPFTPTEHWLKEDETSWTSPELFPNQYVISFVRGNYKEIIYRDIDLEKGNYEININF